MATTTLRRRNYQPRSFFALATAALVVPPAILLFTFAIDHFMRRDGPGENQWVLIPLATAIVLEIILQMVLTYRMWAQIPSEHARVSPGMAAFLIGMPVIKVFYGQFHAFYGLSKDLNTYCARYNVPGARSPSWCALLACIFTCIGTILPVLAAGAAIAHWLVAALALTFFGWIVAGVVGIPALIFGQIAWWSMIAQSARVAKFRAWPATPPVERNSGVPVSVY